ncbi:protein phosphatase Slingshot homolog 2 isoform X2 [Cololabis saira]|uniref:protein phosphatase Slingshot homolog 2 isoform X2 n=1 Tax=Cololabis saira TaxID=129043 RepID=UPI002AD2926D|nr:protein phosphatase Slingshot homolog 2 isoform X2 [Cololabis saira]
MALVTVQRSPTPSSSSSPSVSESGSGEDDRRSQPRSINESFLTVKGAALFLPRGNSPTPNSTPRISQRRNKHTGDLQKHLQTMFTVLRPEDTIRLAVRLESAYPQVTRYMVVVSTNGRQDTEESIVLGMDFASADSCCTVGLVLPLWSDTLIHLDGDGGFSVSTVSRVHVFKPVSVQAMWSALQSLHKACDVARCHNYYPGSLFLTWVSYYQSRISSNQFCINEWNAMQDVESHRANSPVLFTDVPTERERTERLIKMRLREIMMQKDLENVTCKEIRTELEMQMVCNLREFKEFIDNEMIVILGQMDSPTEIFEHVFLGSEWNASNLEELQNSGVRYILNVTREIDNFFPGMFEYHNIRVYDEEATNLLEYWNDTYKFITKAKKAGAKCLVHCKMGVSRSASTVIAYAMKEYGWDLDTALDYVKERRAVTKPNPSFMKQLEEYQGILLASKQRHNKLWRSHSAGDLSDRPESMCKSSPPSLGRSHSHNNNASSSPSLHHFLGVAVLQALGAGPRDSGSSTSLSGSAGGSPGSDCEEPAPFLLPRPRAATVVPEERPDNSASVAVTVPAALPHPPPSLHILPPTPEPRRAHRGALSLDLQGVAPLAPLAPLTLGSSDSDSVMPSLSDSASEQPSPPGPETPPTPLNDDNNNPSELQAGRPLDSRGEADGSSSHSTDSIDFFSAREKFLGLAQDGPRTPADQRREGAAVCEEEEQGSQVCLQPGASPDQTHLHDNGISVRHIVTEIEAIHQSSSSPTTPSSTSSPSLPSSQPEEAEPPEVPPSLPPSPPALPCERPVGAVRRATEQLEQRMKQEQELASCQRSPLHSPGTEQPPGTLSPCPQSPEPPPPPRSPPQLAELKLTQGEDTADAEAKDGGMHAGSHTEIQRLDDSVKDHFHEPSLPLNSEILPEPAMPLTSVDSHAVTSSPDSSLDTSARLHSPGPRPQAASHPAPLQESDSDPGPRGGRPGCGPGCDAQSRLARSSQELEHIQQTLRELQAFLQDGVGMEATDGPGQKEDMDTEQEQGQEKGGGSDPPPPGPAAAQPLRETRDGRGPVGPAGWHRAMELEARIRQAGLTPPSLMKRSASLAKLDCLELSADDLSDLDLRTHTRTSSHRHHSPSSSPSPSHSDDTWKKQKVFPQSTGSSCDDTSSPPSPRLPSAAHEHAATKAERDEPDGSGAAATATARQQGRGHSARRSRKASAEKKPRAVAPLYNTM